MFSVIVVAKVTSANFERFKFMFLKYLKFNIVANEKMKKMANVLEMANRRPKHVNGVKFGALRLTI